MGLDKFYNDKHCKKPTRTDWLPCDVAHQPATITRVLSPPPSPLPPASAALPATPSTRALLKDYFPSDFSLCCMTLPRFLVASVCMDRMYARSRWPFSVVQLDPSLSGPWTWLTTIGKGAVLLSLRRWVRPVFLNPPPSQLI